MKKAIRKYAGVIYIALMSAAVLIVLSCTDELGQVWTAMGSLDGRWVFAALGYIAAYLFLRMAALRHYLARHGVRISWRTAMGATGVGQFYSAITPSASGGQPMQVLWLRRRGVPASLGTACVSAKFLGFQTAFLILGGVLGLTNWAAVSEQIYGLRWLVVAGYAVNGGLIVLVMLTLPRAGIVRWLGGWLVRLGAKLHLVKRPQQVLERFEASFADYRTALLSLLKTPSDALVMFGLSLAQVVAYMGVTVCLYHAFGLSGASDLWILTLQTLLFIAAAFVPLPGAAGAQESGFVVFFRGVFPEGNLAAAMLCWRFFTYYLLMIAGLAMTALAGKRKGEDSETLPDSPE